MLRKKNIRPEKRNLKAGFTLAELAITVAVMSLITVPFMGLFVQSLNTVSYENGKQQVNADIRKFTSDLTSTATFANYPVIYRSFTDRHIQNHGASGDFLVLVFRDPLDQSITESFTMYYRSVPSGTEEGPVLSYTYDTSNHPSLPSSADLADLLPDVSTKGTHDQVIELSKGLSDGKLFYNFFDRSVMVRGEIIHEGRVSTRATNTYNFTVSPRG